MYKLIPSLLAVLTFALLAGCKSSDDNVETSTPSEQGAAASQSLGMLLDASTESVL